MKLRNQVDGNALFARAIGVHGHCRVPIEQAPVSVEDTGVATGQAALL